MKRVVLIGMTLVMASAAIPPSAHAMRRNDNAVFEQRLKLKALWQQSRRAGGYDNPIEALSQLFRGELDPKNIQPGINEPPKEFLQMDPSRDLRN